MYFILIPRHVNTYISTHVTMCTHTLILSACSGLTSTDAFLLQWSFGVTAWEIFTLEEPYEGKYLSDIIPKLEKGKRLSKPQNCADAM